MPETTQDVDNMIVSTSLEDIDSEVYRKILGVLEDVEPFEEGGDFSSEQEYQESLTIIADRIYLIYECVHLKIVREIDYVDIKHFAISNNDLVKYVLKEVFQEEFLIEALDAWTQVHIDMLECAMYRPSNKNNKHVYH
jgi:hypothetical protein